MSITPEKLSELRKLAESATPGPWHLRGRGKYVGLVIGDTCGSGIPERRDGEYIVAFDPTTALALLVRIAELQTNLAELQTDLAENYVRRGWDGLMTLLDDAYPEDFIPTREDDSSRDPGPRIVSLIRLLDRATRERDELQARIDAALAQHREHECGALCAIFTNGPCAYSDSCLSCSQRWPCKTALTLDPSLGGER